MDLTLKQLTHESPSLSEFALLRKSVGWPSPPNQILEKSINSTIYWSCMRSENKLIGTGRIIGDGAMYFYIQDIIVHPDFQGKGLGYRIMQSIDEYISHHLPPHSMVILLAAPGKETFYQQFRFITLDGDDWGTGMGRFL